MDSSSFLWNMAHEDFLGSHLSEISGENDIELVPNCLMKSAVSFGKIVRELDKKLHKRKTMLKFLICFKIKSLLLKFHPIFFFSLFFSYK